MPSNPTNEGLHMHERLRLAREMAGLSQGQTAKIMSMHRPSISEIEAGRRRVSAKELAQFAEIYGVDVDWLLGMTEVGDDEFQGKIRLVARQLSSLREEDLDQLIRLLRSLPRGQEGK